MDILHITNKVDMIYTPEKFHMYNETKIDNQINYICTVRPNIVSDTLKEGSHHYNSHYLHNLVQSHTTIQPTRTHVFHLSTPQQIVFLYAHTHAICTII
jgi:hypothetical protein